MRYILQRFDDNTVFEEVDENIFQHRKKALLGQDSPRYTDNYIVDNGNHSFVIQGDFKQPELAIVMRILGIRENSTSCGFLKRPDYVKLIIRNKSILKENFGEAFKATSIGTAA